MSFIGEVMAIPQSSLDELERIQMRAVENDSLDQLNNFFNSKGQDLGYNYSGQVIMDLFGFLREKGINLEEGEMTGFVAPFLDVQEEGVAVYMLLNQGDRARFLSSLDPVRYTESEMQAYVEELYKPYADQYEGYGVYMKDSQRFLYECLRNLKKESLLYIGVYY